MPRLACKILTMLLLNKEDLEIGVVMQWGATAPPYSLWHRGGVM